MNKCVKYYDGSLDQDKFDKEMLATPYQDGLMSKEDKTKLDELTGGSSQEPASINAGLISQDETHRFVTDEEKAAWNAKPDNKEALELGNVTNDAQVKRSEMGIPSGVATLDEAGLIPSTQLPSYVDDIVEENFNNFPIPGESGKIYVDLDTNKTYRWSGTSYTAISETLALGETSSTAYAGDKGKTTTDAVNNIINGTTTVPKAVDAQTVSGFTVGVSVPSNAVFTDTIYTHPDSHSADMIVETVDKKFVTEAQIAKVNAIPEDPKYTDTVYTHPDTHDATMIVEDETHRFVTDEEKSAWNAKAETTEVTTEANGLMVATDKEKLDAIPKFVNTPYYDEVVKAVFACGVAITIDTTETDGVLKATYVRQGTKSFTFPSGVNIYGGGNGKDDSCFYPATCVTINGGNLHSVCGGNLKAGNVGSATVTINGGSFSSGIVGGGLSSADGKQYDNIVGHVEIIVNNTDGNALTISGGPQGLGIVGDARLTINGGDIKWATAGGNNGYTGYGEVIVNGGTMTVLQGCNRGSMGCIKMTINGGNIERLYAGGETEDNTVTATYKRSEIYVNGGTIGAISAGTSGGVVNSENVSGTYVEGIITDEAATAMNLTKAAIEFDDIALEDKTLVFKKDGVTVKSVDLASINA